MRGEVVLGGVAAFIAFWLLMSALEGLGYAVPSRPSVIVPQRWAVGARALILTFVLGLAASFLVPFVTDYPIRFTFFHLLIAIGVVLPVWELLAVRVYDDCFVIVNGREDIVRPIIIATVGHVFGEMYEEKDMLRSADKVGEDWQLIGHDKEHLVALDPVFKVDLRRRRALEAALQTALKTVKSAGFNERAFWISFMTPLWFAAIYAGIAYYLLHSVPVTPLRGPLG